MPTRTPEEIRRSVEQTREELRVTINQLQVKTSYVTDWRRQLIENRQKALIGAAVAGFVVGGGIAGTLGLFRRRN